MVGPVLQRTETLDSFLRTIISARCCDQHGLQDKKVKRFHGQRTRVKPAKAWVMFAVSFIFPFPSQEGSSLTGISSCLWGRKLRTSVTRRYKMVLCKYVRRTIYANYGIDASINTELYIRGREYLLWLIIHPPAERQIEATV